MARKKQRFNSANPDHVDRAAKNLEHAREDDAYYWKQVLDTYAGRAVVWDVLGKFGIFDHGYTGDSGLSHYIDGRQSIGKQMWVELLTDHPKAFKLMQSEADKRDENRKDNSL